MNALECQVSFLLFWVFLHLYTMKWITYLRENYWTTLRLKQLLTLHHLDNFLRETLHCCLSMKNGKVRLAKTWINGEKSYQWNANPTLKGSLSVLKLIPGTYFNHTGIPLKHTIKERDYESQPNLTLTDR